MAKGSGGTKSVDKTHKGLSFQQVSQNIDKLSSDWHNSKVLNLEKVFSHNVASTETQDAIKKVIEERGGFGKWGVIKPTETVKEVSLSSLHPTQDMVLSSNVKNIVSSISSEGMREMPTAVNYNGKIYIMDGHHRVAAAILLKQKSIKLRIL